MDMSIGGRNIGTEDVEYDRSDDNPLRQFTIPNVFPGDYGSVPVRYDPYANIIYYDDDFNREDALGQQYRITADNFEQDPKWKAIWEASIIQRREIQMQEHRDTGNPMPNMQPAPPGYNPQAQQAGMPQYGGGPIPPQQPYQPQQAFAQPTTPQPQMAQPPPPPPMATQMEARSFSEKEVASIVVINSQEFLLDLFYQVLARNIPEDSKDLPMLEHMYAEHKKLKESWGFGSDEAGTEQDAGLPPQPDPSGAGVQQDAQ